MPKAAKELGALAVSRLTAPGRHTVGKVAGLALQVTPSGARSWVLRAIVGGKRREIGLGSYPAVSLKEAHARAQDKRDEISSGIDPVLARKEAASRIRSEQAMEITFEEAARRYIKAKSAEWSNIKHADQWKNTLTEYAYPVIGKMLVRHVARPHVVEILEPIWTTKTETAARVRGRIESILDWARVSGFRDEGINPAAWRGNLDKVLSSPKKTKQVRNHPALPIDEMPAFMVTLRAIDGMGPRCLEFAILTAARSGEARAARRQEIDFERGVWVVPAERMKMKKEHRVPLPPAAMRLIKALPDGAPDALLFPGTRGNLLSDMTLLMILRRQKLEATPHGFRSTFRDWASEYTNYPRELAEVALAHLKGDATEAAYWRSDILEKRRRLMTDWANFIGKPLKKGSVTPINKTT
ncbi:phage integrase [Paraburkholderia hospita]|uniref:Phage integrase n=1 Tax=Paraburkholderia hospita TaxID=169430 RepID=A0ABP2PWW6_9BURK|nr:integrase arm-type DNA-binding domain-containing protein [Paraburkholderia hospita]EIN02288.1 phage integrase [Paraburkholderia hospita]OUL72649.1 integrase [Paraburkholderia hospita]